MTDSTGNRESSHYTIEGGEQDRSRLEVQAEALRVTTEELFAKAGLTAGQSCLDVGSGTGHTARLMAAIVGSEGSVTGIDADPETVELARRDAARRGLTNVEFYSCDLFEFDGGGYDFAHCRYVLSHLADPVAAIAQIASYVRPGGVIALEDLDVSGAFCVPDDDEFGKIATLYETVVRGAGGDPRLARRLPLVAAEAGLDAIAWRYHQPVIAEGPAKHIAAELLSNMRAAITSQGAADDRTLDAMIAKVRSMADAPNTLLSLPRLAQVWGQRP